jgi:heptosyltransferase-2
MVDYYLHLLPRSWRTPPVDRQPQLYVSEEETRAACALLQAKGLNSLSSLMGISPGASFGSAKRWDRERFQQVAAEMVNQGMAVVVLGTEQERELGDYILHGLPGHQAVNLAGETDLRLLMAIIRECRWLLTNDSGPMHLADALGTPVVALFGSTDSSWTGPQAAHHQILQAEVPCSPCFMRECPLDRACLQALTVPQVLEKIRIIQDMKSPNQTYPEQPERSTVSAEAIDFP